MAHRLDLAARLPALVLVAVVCSGGTSHAQPAPDRIGAFVVDVHGLALSFPSDAALAASRGLPQAELPGFGVGAAAGFHVYPIRWRAITFGLGGRFALLRAHRSPRAATNLRPVTERFSQVAPQLSLNFGKSDGWSYLSGGIGRSTWSIVADGQQALAVDEERLKTIDYGGGARWFIRPHVAFSFDVRFYAVNPGTPAAGLPPSPRSTFMVLGAGLSVN